MVPFNGQVSHLIFTQQSSCSVPEHKTERASKMQLELQRLKTQYLMPLHARFWTVIFNQKRKEKLN